MRRLIPIAIPLTLETLDSGEITYFRDECQDPLTVALCTLALGYVRTRADADEVTAGLQERDVRWFLSLTQAEARGEVLRAINTERARVVAQEAAEDAATRRASDAHYEAVMRHSHYPDGDPEDHRR